QGPGSGGSGIALVPSASPNPALPISCALMVVLLVPTTDRNLPRGRATSAVQINDAAGRPGPVHSALEPTLQGPSPPTSRSYPHRLWTMCGFCVHLRPPLLLAVCTTCGQPLADLRIFGYPQVRKLQLDIFTPGQGGQVSEFTGQIEGRRDT